ncbi:MAG: hypothetical protein K9N34_03230 [Candidatus Marinimicrobia bacterium]|nr:hypothetical protein [Candidatus Neomarinimicrobiota bacterium]MCF7839446.1 hypothetical protein [Candidatus Neomarinimicrobiota bacterium]MCF7902905.1 hypothetical protein [Candidatus Neomarinimicrobiota bacterium]
MLKKTDAVLFTPGLPVRRMVPRLFPIVVLLMSLMTACQEPEKPEPYPNSNLVLEKLDVSCTEAWLKLSLTRTDSGATDSIPIILTRDGEAIQPFAFTPPETLVMDAGLYPSQSYQYQAQRQSVHDNKVINSSNTLTVTTLDTTSHDFTWTIDTLGSYGSYLNDVAIIDENNIWAVGDVQTDSGRYNLAKWDGSRWNLSLFGVAGVSGDGIFAFSEGDVWITTGIIYHWNDGQWERYHLWDMGVLGPNDGGVTRVWGSSPEDDVWFVGNGGSIVHYDGSGFERMESGTEVDLHEIHGTADGEYIFFQGKHWQGYRTILLQLHHGIISKIYECETMSPGENDYGYLYSSYLSGYAVISATTAGVWQYNYMTEQSVLIPDEVTDSGDRNVQVIIGNNTIDYILAGNWWKLIHFNGISYRYNDQIVQLIGEGGSKLNGGDMRGNLAVICGDVFWWSHAAVAFGRRQ